MFIAGAVVVGGIIVAYDDHSRHSQYKEHTNHSKYNDHHVREEIISKENSLDNQKSKVDRLWDEYSNLPSWDIEQKKYEMRRELEQEIAEDKQKLADIEKMIARINEIELQSRKE